MKQKLWLGLGFLLFLIICLYTVNGTLAKYRKNIDSSTSVQLASWNILINNESILGTSSLSKTIEPIFPENDYVKEGVIAPGSKGYYDIILDASQTDVSFIYKITSEIDKTSIIKDFIITSYEINPSTTSVIEPYKADTGINGDMLHNSGVIIIRIYVEWNDDILSETMDNKQDTEAARIPDGRALLITNITFSQKKA